MTNPGSGLKLKLTQGAGWSSQVARRAHNPKAGGSNPPPATISFLEQSIKTLGKFALFCLFSLILTYPQVHSGIITELPAPSSEKLVALTFDACETKTPSYFDLRILDFLLRTKTPFTLFISGRFARRPINSLILRALSRLDFVEIENHSLNHIQHMERLNDIEIIHEVKEDERIITSITGKKTRFFRFPGGNCNDHAVRVVESLGYRVAHWTFPSGDPDKNITPERLERWVIQKTKPNSILIFHINGRGYSTAKALPVIVHALKEKGYRFVKLNSVIR